MQTLKVLILFRLLELKRQQNDQREDSESPHRSQVILQVLDLVINVRVFVCILDLLLDQLENENEEALHELEDSEWQNLGIKLET